jgi:hypothetical protein
VGPRQEFYTWRMQLLKPLVLWPSHPAAASSWVLHPGYLFVSLHCTYIPRIILTADFLQQFHCLLALALYSKERRFVSLLCKCNQKPGIYFHFACTHGPEWIKSFAITLLD